LSLKIETMRLKTVLQTTRPSFLVLTPVCVFLGLSTSLTSRSPTDGFLLLVLMLGAISAHIGVNALNEYYDFKSGLDLRTEKTPFSGGSGALPANPGVAGLTLIVGLASLVLTIAVGIYFVLERGIHVLPIGLVGVGLIITYTQWINRLPLLCLIAPGLGFGVLMVVGTHVVLGGEHYKLTWLVSLVPFFLVNNLLLLNQYPDIKADASVGRKTFPIAFGVKRSNLVYALFMVAAYSLLLLLVVKGYVPDLGVIALIPMGLSLFALAGAVKYTLEIGSYPRYMGANVAAAVLTPLLLGISMIYG